MNLEEKVFTPEKLEVIQEFVSKQFELQIEDPSERMFALWESSLRLEGLEHYASTGWSFYLEDSGEVKGLVLGQMVVFFQGNTQTLWIEHIESSNVDNFEQLVDIAVRWGRDKHLQKVFFNPKIDLSKSKVFSQFQGVQNENGLWMVKTTKSQN